MKWWVFSAIVLCAGVVQAADLPRYSLPPGRVLNYSATATQKQPGGVDLTQTVTWRLTVVRENPDGSRRLIVRMSSAISQGGRPSTERVSIGYVDLFPDGRTIPNPTTGPQLDVSSLLPLLPSSDAQLSQGWDHNNPVTLTTTTYKTIADAGGEWVFSATQSGALSRIYETTSESTLRFDRAKGMVSGSEGKVSQRYGFNSTGTSKTSLKSEQMILPNQIEILAKDYDALIEAQLAVNGIVDVVAEDPSRAEARFNEMKLHVDAAASRAQSEEVKEQFAELIKRNDEMKSYLDDTAGRLTKLFNHPAEWSARDWDGGEWSHQKLRGKVVVMDFWYRGCGWCMYAMPQVRQLAIDFKDQPVVVLGMNTDAKEEDARLVIKELDMQYPQVRSSEVAQKLGIQAFPTTMIIDQQGVVRGVFIGYSPDLGEKLARKVKSLLEKE